MYHMSGYSEHRSATCLHKPTFRIFNHYDNHQFVISGSFTVRKLYVMFGTFSCLDAL